MSAQKRFIQIHLAECSLWRSLKKALGDSASRFVLNWGTAPPKFLWDKIKGIG